MPATTDTNRNPGHPLDVDWPVEVDAEAVEARAAGLRERDPEAEVPALLRLISMIDLTTLNGTDTAADVRALCERAANPVPAALLEKLGHTEPLTVGAAVMYPVFVSVAAEALTGTGVPIATVSAGFPSAQMPLEPQLEVARQNIEEGMTELDIVISRRYPLTGGWQALYDEVKAFREVCGDDAHLKVILETGELPNAETIYRASLVAMMAGADFIKTSTGKAKVNATLEAGYTMMRAIRAYEAKTGARVGFKPAGGLRTTRDALIWLSLMDEELGTPWAEAGLLRIGASSLLDALVASLEQLTP